MSARSLYRRDHVGNARTTARIERRQIIREQKEDMPRPEGLVPKNRYFPKVGDKYGQLTIVEQVANDVGQGRRWRLRCDCGTELERESRVLNLAQRSSRGALMCQPCRRSLFDDLKRHAQQKISEGFRKQFVDYRTLWLPHQTAHMQNAIWADLEAEYGEIDAPEPSVSLDLHPTYNQGERRGLTAKLSPEERLAAEDAAADIERDEQGRTLRDPTSPDAPRGEQYTLLEIGKVFGLSRERIRQIEMRALKKMRAAIERNESGATCRKNRLRTIADAATRATTGEKLMAARNLERTMRAVDALAKSETGKDIWRNSFGWLGSAH